MNDRPRYEHDSMVIQWSPEDAAYDLTVPELPGCRTHGSTYEEAVRNGREVIRRWIDATRERGRPIPRPNVVGADWEPVAASLGPRTDRRSPKREHAEWTCRS